MGGRFDAIVQLLSGAARPRGFGSLNEGLGSLLLP
jgi:hypothetical protein